MSGLSDLLGSVRAQAELHVSFPLAADFLLLQLTFLSLPTAPTGRAKASELVGRAGGAAEETAESARRAAKEAAPAELAAR